MASVLTALILFMCVTEIYRIKAARVMTVNAHRHTTLDKSYRSLCCVYCSPAVSYTSSVSEFVCCVVDIVRYSQCLLSALFSCVSPDRSSPMVVQVEEKLKHLRLQKQLRHQGSSHLETTR